MNIEIFKNISAVVGCAMACITLIAVIIKPIRLGIIKYFAHKTGSKERDNQITMMNDKFDSMDQKLDLSLRNDDDMKYRLDKVEDRVLRNELDRLKQYLFDCGARCRRGIPLFPEEMAQVRDAYTKYSEELHGNGIGHMEYEFICDYYDKQDFSKI